MDVFTFTRRAFNPHHVCVFTFVWVRGLLCVEKASLYSHSPFTEVREGPPSHAIWKCRVCEAREIEKTGAVNAKVRAKLEAIGKDVHTDL
jgi:hypothetical protein